MVMELNIWQLALFVVIAVLLFTYMRRIAASRCLPDTSNHPVKIPHPSTKLAAEATELPFPFPEARTCRNCRYSTISGSMGCLIHADGGRVYEGSKIKHALETHQCEEFKHRNGNPSCRYCTGENGEALYPQYGVAPHNCYYKIPGAVIGESQLLPKEEWPENFIPDPDNNGCGVWFCPVCRKGQDEHVNLIANSIIAKAG